MHRREEAREAVVTAVGKPDRPCPGAKGTHWSNDGPRVIVTLKYASALGLKTVTRTCDPIMGGGVGGGGVRRVEKGGRRGGRGR